MAKNGVEMNIPGVDTIPPDGRSRGAEVTVHTLQFRATSAANSVIAAVTDPFGSGSTFATVGNVPAQLALSAGNIVKGAGAAVVGQVYTIYLTATASDGARLGSGTLPFTAI